MSFRGKNAVVTGGAGGIGLQVSKQLLTAGAAVAIIDIQDNLEEFVKLRAAHPTQSVMIVKMDVANKKGVEATYEEIAKTFGSIDIVVNVAGIFNDKDVQRTLLVNLGGIINSTLSALPYMSKDNGGKGGIVINMSSVVGLDPMFIIPVYGATKAGILNFTRCLANDKYYARSGIKFVTVCPGATMTDMFTNFTEKIIFPETSDETYRILDRLNKQSAADVSRCILSVLEKDKNGAVYVIEGKRVFPMELKPQWTGKEQAL
ncbi:alcohol dehydrogenase isoform X2 [Drosophila persimilis]|uniref:Fat body protein 2 n=1 Tax=Drosophila pseudoobscura pseudoobscura TaxID=46245 RepID=A0A0R3P665_DROPS|nr:alcohol dehydrogenase isoform X2 [Drosophila pseudoobscura]XP_026847291.1 alcohol dehydrogenase isoform X2 [Drosophila persimilis]